MTFKGVARASGFPLVCGVVKVGIVLAFEVFGAGFKVEQGEIGASVEGVGGVKVEGCSECFGGADDVVFGSGAVGVEFFSVDVEREFFGFWGVEDVRAEEYEGALRVVAVGVD